jgi:hypothetical protein
MGDQAYILQGNLFFDFLEESIQGAIYPVAVVWEGKIEERDFSFPK